MVEKNMNLFKRKIVKENEENYDDMLKLRFIINY